MTSNKRFDGLWNAAAEKRYKHFITYTVDYESAWLLANDNGFATIDVDGYIHLLVWPAKEFAVAYSKEDTPVEMEIHEFCERCEKMINDELLNIPNEKVRTIAEDNIKNKTLWLYDDADSLLFNELSVVFCLISILRQLINPYMSFAKNDIKHATTEIYDISLMLAKIHKNINIISFAAYATA